MNEKELRKEIARLRRPQEQETDSVLLLAIKYRLKELQSELDKLKND